MEETDTP